MTDNVTTSASLIFGVIPTLGRAGACSGELFNKSSTRTYSAVARVSRSASTMSLLLDVGLATPVLDTHNHYLRLDTPNTPWNNSTSPLVLRGAVRRGIGHHRRLSHQPFKMSILYDLGASRNPRVPCLVRRHPRRRPAPRTAATCSTQCPETFTVGLTGASFVKDLNRDARKRDQAAARRDQLGDRRDEKGHQRDKAAGQRDEAAEQRDEVAGQRDLLGEQ